MQQKGGNMGTWHALASLVFPAIPASSADGTGRTYDAAPGGLALTSALITRTGNGSRGRREPVWRSVRCERFAHGSFGAIGRHQAYACRAGADGRRGGG